TKSIVGAREEMTIGKISVQESVSNDLASAGLTNTAAVETGSADTGAAPQVQAATETTPAATDVNAGLPAPYSAPKASNQPTRRRTGLSNTSGGPAFRLTRPNLGLIAGYAAGAAGGLGLCIWLMLGVVSSLAKGTPLRLPGL